MEIDPHVLTIVFSSVVEGYGRMLNIVSCDSVVAFDQLMCFSGVPGPDNPEMFCVAGDQVKAITMIECSSDIAACAPSDDPQWKCPVPAEPGT